MVAEFDGLIFTQNRRMRYGTTTPQQRPHDRGGGSSDTTESREPTGYLSTRWNLSQTGGNVDATHKGEALGV